MTGLIVQALWLSALAFIVGWMLFSLAMHQWFEIKLRRRLDRRVHSLRRR